MLGPGFRVGVTIRVCLVGCISCFGIVPTVPNRKI